MLEENFTSQIVADGSQISKNATKNVLKEYEKTPITIGDNFIEIKKISDKCVIINEQRNGLIQQDKKISLEKAIDYINYKKSLMIKGNQINSIAVNNEENTSSEYKTQMENYEEVLIDIMNIIHNIWKNVVIGGTSFNVNETDGIIEIFIENKKIEIRCNNLSNELTFHANYDISQIHSQRDYVIQKCTVDTGRLLFETDKQSVFFRTLVRQAIMMKSQLKILASVYRPTNNLVIDDAILENIENFVNNGKKSDILEFSYGKHRHGSKLYERVFEVHKETKIRTEVNVYSYLLDDKGVRASNEHRIIEYNNPIVKMNKEPKKKVRIIASDYVWNK